MVQNSLTNNNIDKNFKKIALDYLSELEAKYNAEDLKKINFNKLKILVDTVENYRPKSHIREEKRTLLKYFCYFFDHPIAKHSYKELLELQRDYVLGLISGYKLNGKGFEMKWSWLYSLIFILPLDILLWVIGLGKYYFYIPIITIPFVISQLRKERKAKREGKLW